ncbi:SGNH/GDSL hydrolase family protein [Protaetiibacter intestinalis]|nr:SGNH/GDSL hydrolase family protein [Protaetiibacter intestinalis]
MAVLAAGVIASVAVSGADLLSAQASTPQPEPELREVDAANGIAWGDREAVLGRQWADSSDQVSVVVGGREGLAVLHADEAHGYAWNELTSLPTNDPDADLWISNSCVTSSGRYMAVVYGPRTITNSEEGFGFGATAAIVDLSSGAVRELGTGYSIAYFNPGCGAGDTFTLSADAPGTGGTLIAAIEASSGRVINQTSVNSQATSAVSDEVGTIYAVSDGGIIGVPAGEKARRVSSTSGITYDLSIDATDRLGYVAYDGTTASAYILPLAKTTKPTRIATGPVTELGIRSAQGGGFYLLGGGVKRTLADDSVKSLPTGRPNSVVSSTGKLVVTSVKPAGIAPASDKMTPDDLEAKVAAIATVTGRELAFNLGQYEPSAWSGDSSEAPARGAFGFARPGRLWVAATAGDPHDPVESERYCSVPRNDPDNQAYQPKPRQVEWAVDRAVKGQLTVARPANWRNLGMTNYAPQVLIPPVALTGGGTMPPQVVLGVLMQESNMWQASRFTAPGNTGNPLIGNFYGNQSNLWSIDWTQADCGYGVGQITDGMRIAGHDGGTALTYAQQRAIALDYTANIAMTVRMLGQKWNQLKSLGITINDGSASSIENWFAAVWIYNTGLQPSSAALGNGTGCSPGPSCTTAAGTWGLGWSNNPINPKYPPSRLAFLANNNAADAAQPQNWPYPEKVMGFAAWGLTLVETQWTDAPTRTYPTRLVPSYTLAWWTTNANRDTVKPPLESFCDPTVNGCYTTNPCTIAGSFCYWHGNVTWKNCGASECGFGNERFSSSSYPTENSSMSNTALDPKTRQSSFLPNCSAPPVAMLVVDDTPHADARNSSVEQTGDECVPQSRTGSFQFTFGSVDPNGSYPAKVDLHQQGGGFNGHFYFAHTQEASQPSRTVTGTWSLGQSLTNQWTRVWIHLPDYAGWTDSAAYTVNYAPGKSQTRYLAQRRYASEWVPIGVFQVDGSPTVTLSNLGRYNMGVDDVAWDAVGFETLSSKPSDFVVALGDSFSSGEGAGSYEPYSDHDGTNAARRNGCHVSKDNWVRKTKLPGDSQTIGYRADHADASLDYQFLACSGAESEHLLPYLGLAAPPKNAEGEDGSDGTNHQVSQMDRGYLDENTTLVTLSIGGNDMRFSPILSACIVRSLVYGIPCDFAVFLSGDGSEDIATATARRLEYELPETLVTVLAAIKERAPNATIVLMGYPNLFETDTTCVEIDASNHTWLNQLSTDLTSVMSNAAATMDEPGAQRVLFADPQSQFTGHNLCTTTSGINGLVFTQTPGDKPMFEMPVPGPNFGLGVSQESVHPNTLGTSYFAAALEDVLDGVYP